MRYSEKLAEELVGEIVRHKERLYAPKAEILSVYRFRSQTYITLKFLKSGRTRHECLLDNYVVCDIEEEEGEQLEIWRN